MLYLSGTMQDNIFSILYFKFCLLSSNPLLPLIKWNDFQPITVCGSFDMTDSSELKFQRIGQILDRNADSPSLLRQAYPPCLLTVPCSNNYIILFIGQQRNQESGVGGYPGGGRWVEVDGHGLKHTRFRAKVLGRPLG